MDVRSVADSGSLLGADKIFHHLDRLADWQHGRLPYPVTVEIDVCNLCNHRCPECTFSYLVNQSGDKLEFHRALQLIDELANLGVKAVTFSGGGEPMLYGDYHLLQLVRRVRQRGMDAALITNGSHWSSAEFLSLCEWIRVSLDAYDAATFNIFHGRDAHEFQQVVDNLRRMASTAYHYRQHGLKCATLGVGGLTDRHGVQRKDVMAMAEFISQFAGVDYLQFRPMVLNRTKDLSGGYDGSGEIPELLDQIREAARVFDRDDFKVLASLDKYRALAEPDHQRHYDCCHASFLQACVGADAQVYICCHWQGEERQSLGDLNQQSFAEIWHSDRAMELRQSLDPRTSCPPACRLHPQNLALEKWLSAPAIHQNFI